ncbi:50S ribosomal protein L6 [Halobacteriales archaeon SW_7_68_16]|nr:MAG: 50S ribosomal protein L6 [Halobacteriales archaeon SW_7_68_16]
METRLTIPDEATVEIDRLDATISGPNGTVERRLWYPGVTVSVDGDAVVIAADADDADTRATVGTFESHLENAFHGVTDSWEYEMGIYTSHFPMQVSVEDDAVVIENFLGEKAPRRVPIHGETEIEVDDGEEAVYLHGPSIEDVGQTAADIEQATRVPDKDTRVFQDGVYIVDRPRGGA